MACTSPRRPAGVAGRSKWWKSSWSQRFASAVAYFASVTLSTRDQGGHFIGLSPRTDLSRRSNRAVSGGRPIPVPDLARHVERLALLGLAAKVNEPILDLQCLGAEGCRAA